MIGLAIAPVVDLLNRHERAHSTTCGLLPAARSFGPIHGKEDAQSHDLHFALRGWSARSMVVRGVNPGIGPARVWGVQTSPWRIHAMMSQRPIRMGMRALPRAHTSNCRQSQQSKSTSQNGWLNRSLLAVRDRHPDKLRSLGCESWPVTSGIRSLRLLAAWWQNALCGRGMKWDGAGWD